ncbi:MAG: hypothetical protein D6741_07005 [Planctomycetota bacterium]|nr:MAG: hypothetical protein D6741_07005 [Planctomycetota bacterium]
MSTDLRRDDPSDRNRPRSPANRAHAPTDTVSRLVANEGENINPRPSLFYENLAGHAICAACKSFPGLGWDW